MNNTGKKISEFRKLKGWSQEQLAEQSNINLRTLQRIENNENEPRGTTLQLICKSLQIDVEELHNYEFSSKAKSIGAKIVTTIVLLVLSIALIAILGIMTLNSNANVNTVFAGLLLSFFIPFFIVVRTKTMQGMERMLKFGFGYISYLILILIFHGLPIGFSTGLIPCLLISLSTLYFGKGLFYSKN